MRFELTNSRILLYSDTGEEQRLLEAIGRNAIVRLNYAVGNLSIEPSATPDRQMICSCEHLTAYDVIKIVRDELRRVFANIE